MFDSGWFWLAVAVVGLGLCIAAVYASNREHRETLERERASNRDGGHGDASAADAGPRPGQRTD